VGISSVLNDRTVRPVILSAAKNLVVDDKPARFVISSESEKSVREYSIVLSSVRTPTSRAKHAPRSDRKSVASCHSEEQRVATWESPRF